MPRPKQCRYVSKTPHVAYFKPKGIPLRDLEELTLSVEGLEALRLADAQGNTALEAASCMGISRHTFGRVLAEARHTVALALLEGKALRIQGGTYAIQSPCPHAHHEENVMHKVAVSSEGPSLEDMVDPRFGRAGGFVVVDTQDMSTTYIENGTAQTMPQGAGIVAAETVSASGAGVVLSGYVGPKAFMALEAAGIKVCQDMDGMTVGEAVRAFIEGRATFSASPNAAAGGKAL